MPKIPKRFFFLLLAAFILGAALFAYQHAPANVKQSLSPDIKSGGSVSLEETGTPSATITPTKPQKRY